MVRGLPLAGLVTAVVVVDGPAMRPFDIGRGKMEDDPWYEGGCGGWIDGCKVGGDLIARLMDG